MLLDLCPCDIALILHCVSSIAFPLSHLCQWVSTAESTFVGGYGSAFAACVPLEAENYQMWVY
jgi:hypothetical protein